MPTLVHHARSDATNRVTSGTSAAEITQYTISWANLTDGGFAAGDEVILVVFCKVGTNGINAYVRFQIGKGTTYGGRTDFADSYHSWEGVTLSGPGVYGYLHRFTLVQDENIYFSLWGNVSENHNADDLLSWIFKVGGTNGLVENQDFVWAETTPSGDAPTSTTTGATANVPVSGDWAMFGMARWLIDDTGVLYFSSMEANNQGQAQNANESEDTENEVCVGLLGFAPSMTAGQALEVVYRNNTGGVNDCVGTKLLGLRLAAFKDYWGVFNDSNPVTHSVLDTFQEFAGNGAMVHSQTGPVLAFAAPNHPHNEGTKRPAGRIQVDGSDWSESGKNTRSIADNGPNAETVPILTGYASVSAGTHDWDFDIVEDNDVSPNYTSTRQIAFLFSLELAPVVETRRPFGPVVQVL